MKFNVIINSILEEVSREERIKALKSFTNSKQYVIIKITGSYSHTPQIVIDSFGQKRTSKNLRVRNLKFKDYFDTHSLYEYSEVVTIFTTSLKDYYNKPEEALKVWLDELPAEDEDQLHAIRNNSKEMVIAGIEYKDNDRGSDLYVVLPLEQKELLEVILKGVNKSYYEFMNNVEDFTSIWANSSKHLAEYFLTLPGNQRL